MGLNRTVVLASTGLLVLVFSVYFIWQNNSRDYKKKVSGSIELVKTWKLPNELDEVSGIAFLGNNKIAAVQDEDGTIFVYNLNTSKIEKQVKFAGSGDYEGIAVDAKTAYVMKSNGNIYVVKNFMDDPEVREVKNSLSSDNNMEGLFLDKKNSRLLLAVKGQDPNSEDYKGVYAVDLASMELQQEPAFKLTFEDEIFTDIKKETAAKTFFPSEINRNPATEEIFVLEAEDPRLLILDPSGNPKELHHLDKEEFPQPEGLTFDGKNIYISNEGNPATIHQVSIK